MIPFRRDGDALVLSLRDHERGLLTDLTTQLVQLLDDGDPGDPAVARLLPSAYPDDAEAAAEFRRFTADDLTTRKIANARAVLATLADAPAGAENVDESRRRGAGRRDRAHDERRLDAAAQQSWLRSLTDLRLTLGTRLGVTDEGFPEGHEAPLRVMHDIYDWLGYLQESLVQTLTR